MLKMASLTSVTQHRLMSSSLNQMFHDSTLLRSSKSCSLMSSSARNPGSGLRFRSVPMGLRIRSAATKPAKSPAEEEWKVKREVLLQNKVKTVDVNEALRLQNENNFVILDVRPEADFKEAEENPNFIQEVESKLDKNAKIIGACSAGGTMRPSMNLPEGQQSRSLIAAYLLVLNGYKNVFNLDGGLYIWFKQDLPVDSEEEE